METVLLAPLIVMAVTSIDSASRTVEITVAHAECIDVTAITISGANKTVSILGATLFIPNAHMKASIFCGMRGESRSNFVCLPQVHLSTACTHGTFTAVVVWVSLVWDPAPVVALAIDPLKVTGTLSITVTCTICSPSLVGLSPPLLLYGSALFGIQP